MDREFISLLKEVHEQSGLSLREVGALSNLDFSYISRILAGERHPSRDVFISLCAYSWRLDLVETNRVLVAAGYKPIRQKI